MSEINCNATKISLFLSVSLLASEEPHRNRARKSVCTAYRLLNKPSGINDQATY